MAQHVTASPLLWQVLQATVHADADLRSKAIRLTGNRLLPEPLLEPRVLDFAAQHLRMLGTPPADTGGATEAADIKASGRPMSWCSVQSGHTHPKHSNEYLQLDRMQFKLSCIEQQRCWAGAADAWSPRWLQISELELHNLIQLQSASAECQIIIFTQAQDCTSTQPLLQTCILIWRMLISWAGAANEAASRTGSAELAATPEPQGAAVNGVEASAAAGADMPDEQEQDKRRGSC